MHHVHERITFEGSSGTLSGILQIPDGEPVGAVLLAHCFTCSKALKVQRHLATGIEDAGYAVLRFDFTGLGESEGDFADTTVTTNITDLEAAAGYLMARNFGPCTMVGHSLGGAATILAAANLPSVVAVVAIAAPFGPKHVEHLFADADVDRIFTDGKATVHIGGRPFEISRRFFEDLGNHCSPETIASLGRPLLVVHGPEDTIVPISEGEAIFQHARQPKWFAAIPKTDHLFSTQTWADLASAAIVRFLSTVGG